MVTRTLNASGDYAESVEKFVYDAIGNPTTYRGRTLTWGQGGRLTSYLGAVFTYDARGRRLTKNNTSFTYDSQGRLVKQSNSLTFFYDHTGVAGCIYNEQYYTYRKDAQGNIIAILDRRGNVVVEYTYDAWGRNSCIDNTTVNLGTLNPFRYFDWSKFQFVDIKGGILLPPFLLKKRRLDIPFNVNLPCCL